MRERDDVMQLKALHESFGILSEIISEKIGDLMNAGALSQRQYEAISTLLHNQTHLVTMNTELEALGHELRALGEDATTEDLAEQAIEGLDAILLTLLDLATDYGETDLELLRSMTSGQRLARVRANYLDGDRALELRTRAVLVSATNRIDRLRSLFGEVGDAYRNLAEHAPLSPDDR